MLEKAIISKKKHYVACMPFKSTIMPASDCI